MPGHPLGPCCKETKQRKLLQGFGLSLWYRNIIRIACPKESLFVLRGDEGHTPTGFAPGECKGSMLVVKQSSLPEGGPQRHECALWSVWLLKTSLVVCRVGPPSAVGHYSRKCFSTDSAHEAKLSAGVVTPCHVRVHGVGACSMRSCYIHII